MQSQIIYTKLRNELNNELKSELQVVHIFLLIRKFLETKNLKSKYPILNLYSNWVLHSELSHKPTRNYFIGKFEPHVNDGVDSDEVGRNIILNQRHFFVLNELKAKLSDFLKQSNLPNLLTIRPHWPKFMQLLLEILMECPIKINGNKIDSLFLVKDSAGKYCYRFHLGKRLKDNKNVIKIKVKI